MTEPDHTESTKIYKAYLEKKEEAKAAARPFEVEAKKLYESYEKLALDETLKAMQRGWRRTDKTRILEAVDVIYRGYFPCEIDCVGRSGRAKFLCAFCPYCDLGCGHDWPGCVFPNRLAARCRACDQIRRFVSEDELTAILKEYAAFRGFPYDVRNF